MKKSKKLFWTATSLLAGFLAWTLLLTVVDVQAVGPMGSKVGFAALNGWVHETVGCHMLLYTITDWLGLVPVALMLFFGVVGLTQWIKRKKIRLVDWDILALGGFYLLMLGGYLLFEELALNFRPVLIDGFLEASYPSSTTLLVLCVLPTAMLQTKIRLQKGFVRYLLLAMMGGFVAFMVIGRIISGVHWISDIVGGLLLSGGLVGLYAFVLEWMSEKSCGRRKKHENFGDGV